MGQAGQRLGFERSVSARAESPPPDGCGAARAGCVAILGVAAVNRCRGCGEEVAEPHVIDGRGAGVLTSAAAVAVVLAAHRVVVDLSSAMGTEGAHGSCPRGRRTAFLGGTATSLPSDRATNPMGSFVTSVSEK